MITRKSLLVIKAHLDTPQITIITGPRQAGKTTLINTLISYLKRRGDTTLFLDLDREEDMRRVQSQSELLNYIRLTVGNRKAYIFIDEFQRKENAGLFIKGIYDRKLPYKFILSGSGSFELKEKILEGLSGRYRRFRFNTVSVDEFLDYRTEYAYSNKLPGFLNLHGDYDEILLNEYLQFGGYPEVVKTETAEEKRLAMESIFESFIDKDIKDLLGVENTFAIADLLAFLSVKIGKLTNYSELAQRTGLHLKTVKKYLYYLEKTFVIEKIRPYYENPEKELSKMPVFYFKDLGMRNFVFNRLTHYDPIISGPMLFQNLILALLKDKFPFSEIHYWRTKDKAEVDFIIKTGTELIPAEVKFSHLDSDSTSRSFVNFIKAYGPKKAYVVNLSLRRTRVIEDTEVEFIPYFDLFAEQD